MIRPNLFLIGAMKAGTTYLVRLMRGHPDIFMCDPKEPCHFVNGAVLRRHWRWMYRAGYWSSETRYLSLFERAGHARVIGEASTVYSRAPLFTGVPERLNAFNPEARYIYILRDPVERAISHYWHRVRGWRETRPMLRAVREDPQYLDASCYAMQLKNYLRVIPREQILVLTLEQLASDPLARIGSVYAWLGVDPDVRPPHPGRPENVCPESVEQVRGFGILDRVRRSGAYRGLAHHVPAPLRTAGRALAARRIYPTEVLARQACEYLRPMLADQVEELASLLGRRFPEWTTVQGRAWDPARDMHAGAGEAPAEPLGGQAGQPGWR